MSADTDRIRESVTQWQEGDGYLGGYEYDAEKGMIDDIRYLLHELDVAREAAR